MQRFVRRKKRPQPGRGPARWTGWEIVLIVLSLLLIIFPLYAEGYRWLNPLSVPAAPRLQQSDATATSAIVIQRATITPVATSPGGATDTPQPSATTGASPTAANTATTGPSPTPVDTATTGPSPTAANTATTGPSPTPMDTATTGPSPTAANTATTGPSPTAADTATPGTPPVASSTPTTGPSPTPTATLTPLPNEPPLRLDKAASASSVQTNQKFNYTLTVFSNKTSASAITVRDPIDSSLDVLGASATNGSCSTASNVVTCQVTAQNNQPVTINISVQVRSSATAGQRIPNQAVAQDDRSFTAASDKVVVDVSGGGQPAPATNTPGGPTSTNTPVPPGSTFTPTPVSSHPTATTKPSGGSGGGGGGGGGGNNQPAPTSEIVLPPTPQEGFIPLPPTPRPGRRAPTPVGTGRTATPGATATPIATAIPTPDAGVFFFMGSDWGSAFTGQEINYDIVFQNTRESGVINNLSIISALPDNLQFVSANAGYGPNLNSLTSIDPKVLGSEISLKLDELNRGQWVKISIKTKVKDAVATGARIVSQAEATFDGLTLPVRTKPVYVLIVGSDLGPSLQQAQGSTPSATLVSTSTALPTDTPSIAPTAVSSATPTFVASTDSQPASAGAAAPAVAPLPATSQGIPISGILLLGLTLLLRTVRIHRAQSRI